MQTNPGNKCGNGYSVWHYTGRKMIGSLGSEIWGRDRWIDLSESGQKN